MVLNDLSICSRNMDLNLRINVLASLHKSPNTSLLHMYLYLNYFMINYESPYTSILKDYNY